MDELEQQIKAWADAAAPATGESVRAADVIEGHAVYPPLAPVGSSGRGRGRWLAAAAAVLVLAVVGAAVVLRDDGGDHVRAEQPDEVVTTTTTPPVGFIRDVEFRELDVGVTEGGAAPALGSAQSGEQLSELWAAAGLSGTAPEVDFDDQVVVALTVVTDPCLPPLERMQLEGTTEAASLTPGFEVPETTCSMANVRATYLVALSWAETGDDFLVVLDGLRPEDDQETLQVTRRGVAVTTTDPGGQADTTTTSEPEADAVTASLELDGDTVAAGGSIGGTLTVVNHRGKPIEGTTCGGYFVAFLRNAEREQGIARRACLQGFTIPEGTSTYPVEIRASYNSCVAPGSRPSATPECLADGSMPSYPAGEYEVRIDDPQHLVPEIEPVLITVT